MKGVDGITRCTRSVIDDLKQNGVGFVGRYYCATTELPDKKLTPPEAALLSANGMLIAAVYEDAPANVLPAYYTADQGALDGAAALQQAIEIGQPNGSAIYFAIDCDVTDDQIPAVGTYFAAVFDAIDGAYAVGVYGAGALCAAMKKLRLAAYAWLAESTGWNGSATYTGYDIRQSAFDDEWDADVAPGDFGGFRLG